MSTIMEYKNIVTFHPGYYIAEIIEDMGISQGEFARRVGITDKLLDNLVKGQANISYDIANKLAVMLGISMDVWLNLQNTYDENYLKLVKRNNF